MITGKTLSRWLTGLLLLLSLASCGAPAPVLTGDGFSPSDIPSYSGQAYAEVNGGLPYFSPDDLTTEPFERYSPLDPLGRAAPLGPMSALISCQQRSGEKLGW